ncbi:MAG TPA: fatty acid CoA ligase family protein [Pseudomonadota bacterium]|nr:fatty acid CoA ligase family protein [Pseudomonadota bacterium]
MTTTPNIADALRDRAREAPARTALVLPDGHAMSYAALDLAADELAAGLVAIGIGPGVRTVLMVRPGEALFTLMFALFRARAVPVLVDPGIDRRALRQCLAEARPQAFIGIPLAHAARVLLGWGRGSVRTLVTVGPRWFWSGHTLAQLRALGCQPGHDAPVGAHLMRDRGTANYGRTRTSDTASPVAHEMRSYKGNSGIAGDIDAEGSGDAASEVAHAMRPSGDSAGDEGENELAAILYTSGTTGVPKGVEYTHANFLAQVELIRAAFGIAPGEIDLPTFPPFALFDPGLGMTSVIPDMDPTRPAQADPRKLIAAIEARSCTTMFGSPALLDVLGRHAEAGGTRLATLRRVISAGAPVRPDVVARAYRMLPDDATIWTPYGATECLPVAVIEGREILAVGQAGTDGGRGICVGRALAANTVRVIAIDDGPIPRWREASQVPPGEVGEITVAGPTVTGAYFGRPAATALAKIVETLPGGSERIVHRMGDLGWFDPAGRLWFVGRKSHRVRTEDGTLFTEMVEGLFNTHPAVRRTALVGLGAGAAQEPVLCVELARGDWHAVRAELAGIGASHAMSRGIARFLRHRAFPVDIRHNAKIGREALARWVARVVRRAPNAGLAPGRR